MKINEKNQKTEEFIEMAEISKMLKASDSRMALKWCEDLGLPLIPIGKKKVTFRFLVHNELDKIFISQLKKTHPNNWENLFKHYQNNDRYSFTMETILDQNEQVITMISGSAPKSSSAQKFASK